MKDETPDAECEDKESAGGGTAPDDPGVLKERGAASWVRGVELLKTEQLEQAAASFAEAEASWKPLTTHYQSVVLAKGRRAIAFMGLGRWKDALAIFDEILTSDTRTPDFPDELPMTYWARAVCLENLGRLTEASMAICDLIREVGSGGTPKQRSFVTRAFLMQARAAEASGEIDRAIQSVDAAIRQSSQEPELAYVNLLPEAKRMLAHLLEKV